MNAPVMGRIWGVEAGMANELSPLQVHALIDGKAGRRLFTGDAASLGSAAFL
jgi:hypothetical protein